MVWARRELKVWTAHRVCNNSMAVSLKDKTDHEERKCSQSFRYCRYKVVMIQCRTRLKRRRIGRYRSSESSYYCGMKLRKRKKISWTGRMSGGWGVGGGGGGGHIVKAVTFWWGAFDFCCEHV